MVKGRATRDAMKAGKRCENSEGKRDETNQQTMELPSSYEREHRKSTEQLKTQKSDLQQIPYNLTGEESKEKQEKEVSLFPVMVTAHQKESRIMDLSVHMIHQDPNCSYFSIHPVFSRKEFKLEKEHEVVEKRYDVR
ncbi:hypothetical protein YC2023_117832 [Brassica napus]